MKVKKLWALLICLMTAFVLFSFSASAEGDCGHAQEYREWKTTPNSCTAEGKYELICNYIEDGEVCGHIFETEIIPAHNFRTIYVSKTATCTETGIDVVYCSWCNIVENRITERNPENHKFTDWTVTEASTCIKEGTKERKCTRDGCGYVETAAVPIDASAHIAAEGSEWKLISEATCYAEGSEENTCKVCNKTFTRAIPVHSDYGVPSGGCDYNADKYFRGEVKEGNCSQAESVKYTCRDCGSAFTVKGEKDYTKHDFTDESRWIYTEGASCKHPGKLIKQCKNNRNHTVEETYAPHIFEGYEYVITEPGCRSEGGQTVFTPGEKVVKCIYCDEFDTVEIPAGAHSFGDWVHTQGSTCTSGGTATRTCTCGAVTETTDFEPYTHLNYSGYMMAPTCTESGYEHVQCKQCNTQFYVFPENLAAKGEHTPGKWVVTKAESCTESGERELHCDICDAVYKKEVIPQRLHSNITLKEGFDATCEQSGITDLFYCSTCATVYEQEVIPALGHNFVDQFTPGEGAVKICDRCFEYEIVGDAGDKVTCDCLCHNSNGLAKFVWKIVSFFLKLFGSSAECKCGVVHF